MNSNVSKNKKPYVSRIIAIVACMMFTVMATAQNVITVTNANDSGEGSLRAAIYAAASGDTINVNLDERSVIYLDSTLDISGKNLTINGNSVILDGSRISSPILHNNGTHLTSVTVNINRVHFRNGSYTGGGGGGAIHNDGNLVLHSCIFSNNTTSQYGGAIRNNKSAAISGCTFYNNSATDGGAIANMYLVEVKISYPPGGTINIQQIYHNARLTFTGNIFYENVASNRGNSLYNYGNSNNGGYNVYDSSPFNTPHFLDRKTYSIPVAPDVFYLANGSEAAGVITSLHPDYPVEDFYGDPVVPPAAAGAVQQKVRDNSYAVDLIGVDTDYATVTASSDTEPYPEGTYPSGTNITFTANFTSTNYRIYWLVNGERHERNGGTETAPSYTLTVTENTVIRPIIYYEVSNINDDGEGSLRTAILTANIGPGISLINVSPSLSGQTIALTSVLPQITQNVTLNGNGVIIDGSGITASAASQMMHIYSYSAKVIINRVHFKSGRATDYGAAIRNDNATLTINSCIFTDNRTTASEARGGAIYNRGTLTVNGCTFRNNKSGRYGEAIHNESETTTLTGNLFTATNGNMLSYNSGTFTSAGYNVQDVNSSILNATGDRQASLPTVSPLTFRLLNGSEAADVISTLPENYPAEDFYGNTIVAPAAAGAVQERVAANTYCLYLSSNNTDYGTATPNITLDADGSVASGSVVTLTATPATENCGVYWLINGERKESNGGTPTAPAYTLTVNAYTVAQAVFYRIYEVTTSADAGTGSLREAITAVNSDNYNGVINVNLSDGSSVIALTSPLPQITNSFIFDGNGVTVDGSGITASNTSQMLYINNSSARVIINRVHFKSGRATNYGAAIRNAGATLTLNSCIFTDNETTEYYSCGGAIYNTGTLTVNGCTFCNNKNRNYGGAIYNDYSGKITPTGNLFYNNTAASGKSYYNNGTITSGGYNINDENRQGDKYITARPVSPLTFRLLNGSEAADVITSLPENYPDKDFYGNDIVAPAAAGAVQERVAANMYHLSVSSINTNYGSFVSTVTPDDEGLVPAGSITFTATLAAADCGVYWLINGERQESNGGTSTDPAYTFTINANTVVQTIFHKTYQVTNTNNTGSGSLREAITAVNSDNYGVINVNLNAGSVIALTTALPQITKSFTLNGNGVIIDGSRISSSLPHILYISSSSASVSIRRVHFRNGKATGYGGAIRNTGALELQSCIFSSNETTASNAYGGAIYSSGSLTVRGCTFYSNSSGYYGGAIYSSSGSTTLVGNLFYGNTARVSGNVVYVSSGTVVSGGYNVYDGSSYRFSFDGDGDKQTNVLTVSPNNFHLLHGSAALGVITSLPEGYPDVDFLGSSVSAPAAAGAIQQQVSGSGYYLSVTSNDNSYGTVTPNVTPDADGLVPAGSNITLTATPVSNRQVYWLVNGERHESTGGTTSPVYEFAISANTVIQAVFHNVYEVTAADDEGAGSLRAALIATNTNGTSVINVAPSVAGQTIVLNSKLPQMTKSFTLNGNGITVDGSRIASDNSSQILYINIPSASVNISRVHFKDGKATDYGGAIRNSGNLVLQSCIFSGNRVTSTYAYGGAVYNSGILTVRGCTFYNNSSSYYGGAIYNNSSSLITLTGNLFFDNTASTGSVIYNSSTIVSEGYNVYDGSNYSFNFNASDKQTDSLTVASVSFRLLKNSEAANVISSLPDGYPVEDFYGNPVPTPAAAGAVQSETGSNGYALRTYSNNTSYGTVAIETTPDAEGLFSGSVTLRATPASGYGVYWIVNGNMQTTSTESVYTFTITSNTVVQAVFGNVYGVTTTDNEGPGSLREAIRAVVNSTGSADKIVIVNLPPGSVIRLTETLPYISKSFTLYGNGVTIDGSGIATTYESHILRINTYSITITVHRVHFKSGKSGNGGAIYNIGNLVLQSCIFSDNQATAAGGAIYNNCASSGSLTVNGCTFYDNHGDLGGAIYNSGTNTSSGTNTNSMTLTGNVFYGNTATEGDVISNNNGTVVSGYNVYDGSSYNFSFNGESDKQTDVLPVLPSNFYLLNDGEAAGFITALPAGYPTVDFYGNTVSTPASAGAVQQTVSKNGYLLSLSSNFPAYGTVTPSVTPDADGFVPVGSNVTLTANLEANCKVAYWTVNGERIESAASTYTFTVTKHTTVQTVLYKEYEVSATVDDENEGSLRAAINAVNEGSGMDVINVSPSLTGQTIALTSPLPYITNSFILNGNGIAIDGSDIPSDYSRSIFIYDTYKNNKSISSVIHQVHFKNNNAIYGGAIYIYYGDLNLISCIFSGNQSTPGTGGAITNSGKLTIRGCTFYNNRSDNSSVIYNTGTLNLTGNLFYGNTAEDGNIILSSGGTVISGGYNVHDDASNKDLNFNAADADLPDYYAETSISDLETFAPAPAALVVPAGVEGFPTTDFYGELRRFPGAAGAIESTTRIEITDQPATTTTVTESVIAGSLSISATVEGDLTLSYQWYSNADNSNSGGAAIAGATNSSFTIPINLTEGTYYYFCEVNAGDNSAPVRSSVATVTVNKAALSGTVAITGTATYGQTLTAVTTGLTSNPAVSLGTPSYQWKRDGTDIDEAINSIYILVQGDIGTTVSVEVTTSNTRGSVSSAPTSTVTKIAQNAPPAPACASKTATSITLNEITGAEYRNGTGGTWENSSTFDELTPNTGYTFYARLIGDNTHDASPASASSEVITTDKATLGGTVTISGTATFGETLSATATLTSNHPLVTPGAISYQWKRNGTDDIAGATGSTYILAADDVGKTVTVTATAANCSGSVSSDATATVSKAAQTAPEAPTCASTTSTSVTLNPINGAEYRNGTTGTWQPSPTFTGLAPNTAYDFYARIEETATHEASPISGALSVTTDPTPSYGISLNPAGNHTFADAVCGYGAQAAYSVTVYNAGNQATGDLTVALSGVNSGSFTLSKTGIASVAVGGSDDFTVVPKTGLAAEAYVATVTVSGTNITSATISLSFTVNKAAQAAPNAPTLAGKTSTSVTLTSIPGAEYRNGTGGGWEESPVFNGLIPNTAYDFYARKKETATHEASPISDALSVTTDPTPNYGISLNPAGNHTFADAVCGYGAQAAYSVTVYNVGNQATGDLTVALSGANSGSFTLSKTGIASLAIGVSDNFTVVPKTGLATGVYTASLAITGGNGISATFSLSFTVNKATQAAPEAPTCASKTSTSVTLTAIPGAEYRNGTGGGWENSPVFNGLTPNTVYEFYARKKETATHEASPVSDALSVTTEPTSDYGISLNPSGNHTFADAAWGYGTPTACSVTVSNAGNQPTGDLTVALSGANSGSFTLSKTGIASLTIGVSDNFTVVPKTGLATGTYVATVSIAGGNGISVTFDLSFTVNKVAQTAPAAPTLANKTSTSVTLNTIAGAEYRNGTTGVWQPSPTFDGLHPSTTYTFYARMKGSDTHEESPASDALSVTTDPTPNYGVSLNPSGNYTFADAVWGYDAQTAYSVTVSNAGSQPTGNLTLASGGANGDDNFTLSKTGIASLAVNGSDNFTVVPKTGLDAGTYVAAVSITGGNGISATFDLSFTVNKAAQAAPAAPTLAGKTGTSVTLNLIEGAEYRRDTEGWQDSPTFYGLSLNTEYAFYARLKETGNHEASPVSEALHETTLAIATAELLSLAVNGIPVSVENDELQYSAECEETSVTLDVTASTPDITVNGAEYDNGQTITLTEDVTVIDISLVSGDDQKTYTLEVMKSVEAGSVLFRRWDGVLALIHNPKNNGNRKIDSVRWYVNDSEEVQGTDWFIRTTRDINDYNAEIRVSGNWHNVCGAPRERPAGKVIAYPNPVSVGDNLTLQLPDDFVGGYVNVFNLTGAPVKQRLPLPDRVGVISVADWSPGIYLLNIINTNGDSETIKIIVNN